MNESPLVYLDCPHCKDRIRTPFTRGGPPTVYIHFKSNRASCRLVVQIAATGSEHRLDVVPDRVSLENALMARLQMWEQHTRGNGGRKDV